MSDSPTPTKTKPAANNGLTAEQLRESNNLVLFQESIKREVKYYRSSPPYHVSLQLKKKFINSMKPNTMVNLDSSTSDAEWDSLFTRLSKQPREKYQAPQTTAQEIGWEVNELLPRILDRRFHHARYDTDVTKMPLINYKSKNAEPAPANAAPKAAAKPKASPVTASPAAVDA